MEYYVVCNACGKGFVYTDADLKKQMGAAVTNMFSGLGQIPFGTTYIGPRAFANSGLMSITIPETIKEIDPTAFEGISDAFTIYAPQYSYGHEFAMNHRYNWAEKKRRFSGVLAGWSRIRIQVKQSQESQSY